MRLDTVAAIDAVGERSEVRSVLLAPGDPEAVSLAEPPIGPEAGVVALHLRTGDGEAAIGTLATWIEQVVPEALGRSPELLRLIFALEDPALVTALETAADSFAPSNMANAIHVSPECKSLRARVHAETIAPCRRCAELDPNIDSAAGPNDCGTGKLDDFEARCEDRTCRCACPAYEITACDLGSHTIDCVPGTVCSPATFSCKQETCPAGSVRNEQQGFCQCTSGIGRLDNCRPGVLLSCDQ